MPPPDSSRSRLQAGSGRPHLTSPRGRGTRSAAPAPAVGSPLRRWPNLMIVATAPCRQGLRVICVARPSHLEKNGRPCRVECGATRQHGCWSSPARKLPSFGARMPRAHPKPAGRPQALPVVPTRRRHARRAALRALAQHPTRAKARRPAPPSTSLPSPIVSFRRPSRRTRSSSPTHPAFRKTAAPRRSIRSIGMT